MPNSVILLYNKIRHYIVTLDYYLFLSYYNLFNVYIYYSSLLISTWGVCICLILKHNIMAYTALYQLLKILL